jgi:hypothetical protein
MKTPQLINLSNEIWLSMNELAKLVPTYMVCLNLTPQLIYNCDVRTQSEIRKDLKEYVEQYSDIITIVRILKTNLSR